MTGLLETIDLMVKVLLSVAAIVGIIFAAGKTWAGLSKAAGSQEALHRRLTEIDQKSELRYAQLVEAMTNIRIDVAKFHTWRSTMRFQPPKQNAQQDMFEEGDR